MPTRPRLGLVVVIAGLLVAGAFSAAAVGDNQSPVLAGGMPSGGGPPAQGEPAFGPVPLPTSTAPSTTRPSLSTVPGPPESPATRPATPATTWATTRTPAGGAPPGTPTTGPGAVVPGPTTTTGAAVPPAGNTASDALDALNRDRTSNGLAALRVRPDLQTKAQAWADRLARENALYHSNLPDGLATCWTGLGENIASGASVGQGEQMLMKDPPHRATLLGRWDWVGVGVARTSTGLIVVQDFMSGCP